MTEQKCLDDDGFGKEVENLKDNSDQVQDDRGSDGPRDVFDEWGMDLSEKNKEAVYSWGRD